MAAGSSSEKQNRGQPGLIATRIAEMKSGLIQQMEFFVEETAALAVGEVRRLEEIKGSLEATVARVQAELREKEEMLRKKDSLLGELENQVRKKEELLEDLKREMGAFKAPPQGAIALSEENAFTLRDLEAEWAQGSTPSDAKVAPQGPGEGTVADTRAKAIEYSTRDVVIRPGKGVNRQGGQTQETSRLASLLAPVKRKN